MSVEIRDATVMAEGAGARIELEGDEASDLMVAAGHPHGEPIRQRGPYVD